MLREHSLVIREVIIEFVNFELRKISLFIKEKLKLTVIFSKHNHFIKGDYVNYVKSILIKKGKKKKNNSKQNAIKSRTLQLPSQGIPIQH